MKVAGIRIREEKDEEAVKIRASFPLSDLVKTVACLTMPFNADEASSCTCLGSTVSGVFLM